MRSPKVNGRGVAHKKPGASQLERVGVGGGGGEGEEGVGPEVGRGVLEGHAVREERQPHL